MRVNKMVVHITHVLCVSARRYLNDRLKMCLRGFLATARDFRRPWKCERGWETAGFVSAETVETQVRLTHISCQWNLLLGTQMSAFSSVSIGWNSFSWLADCILKQDNWILIPDVKHLAMTYYNRPKKKHHRGKQRLKIAQ